MMAYSIHPVTQEILEDRPGWLEDYELCADGWANRESHSIVLVKDGEPLGVRMMWHEELHRSHYSLQLRVAPELETEQAAAEIVGALLAQRRLNLPVTASGVVGSQQDGLLNALGVKTIQIVPPATIRTSVPTERALTGRFVTLPASAVAVENLVEAGRQMYLWTHANWAPVREEESALIGEALGVREADLEASSVVLGDAGEVRALSLVWTDDSKAELIAETIKPDEPYGELMVESCVRRSLDQLRARSFETADFDGHATDTHFFPLWIRLEPQGKWFRIVGLLETAHLFRSPANARRLLESYERAKSGETERHDLDSED